MWWHVFTIDDCARNSLCSRTMKRAMEWAEATIWNARYHIIIIIIHGRCTLCYNLLHLKVNLCQCDLDGFATNLSLSWKRPPIGFGLLILYSSTFSLRFSPTIPRPQFQKLKRINAQNHIVQCKPSCLIECAFFRSLYFQFEPFAESISIDCRYRPSWLVSELNYGINHDIHFEMDNMHGTPHNTT